jgi:hypothetical protein
VRRVALTLQCLMCVAACLKREPVSAPVIDVAATPLDASVLPIGEGPPPRSRGGEVALTGRWEGVGTQDDQTSWPMIVEISTTRAGVCAAVEYPSIPCRAEWVCMRDREGTLEARERLLDDSALRCVDDGTMTMRLTADGTLDWQWRGAGQSATAKLRRSR